MADRVLPSREEAAEEMALAASVTEHDNRLSDMAWETFMAYMDGRLVDREAIDQEAAINAFDEEGWDEAAGYGPAIWAAVAAALGSSDG